MDNIQTNATTGQAGELFRQGQLEAAIVAATEAVRAAPTQAELRIFLAELLIFDGALERADAALVAAEATDATLALAVAEFRQLLRAAEARRQWSGEGRLPEFIGGPTEHQSALLASLVAARAGDARGAAREAERAEAIRPPAPGIRNGTRFDDCRDACDTLGGTLEVLTTTGKFFWIPIERVLLVELHPPQRARDLAWRRCTMMVEDGPEGDVYLPAIYDPGATRPSEALRLGRATTWSEQAPVQGMGQRMLLVGEDGVPLHDLGVIEFAR